MRVEDTREGVPEIGERFIGQAKGAVGQDLGTVLEVEASSVQAGDTVFELVVEGREGVVRSEEREAGEEDVVGGLDAGGCEGEDVFGGEVGEGGEEGEEDGDEEDV